MSVDGATLRAALAPVTCLRLSTEVAGYSVYPTTEAEVAVNAFLWRAVAANGFDGAEAAALFLRNVYVLAIPDYLYDFMRAVSMEKSNEVVLFILSTIAEAESPEGLRIMQAELAPSFWAALVTHMADRRRLGPSYAPPLDAFRRMMDGVLDHICSLSAWRAEVGVGFLTSSDMAALLDAVRPSGARRAGGGDGSAAAGTAGGRPHRAAATATTDAVDAASGTSPSPSARPPLPPVAAACAPPPKRSPATPLTAAPPTINRTLWRLYQDWTVWVDLLLVPSSAAAAGGSVGRAAALAAMADAICHDAQPAVAAATRAVVLASRRPLFAAAATPPRGEAGAEARPNYLALLPADVLRCLVVPALAVASASLVGGVAGGKSAPQTPTSAADAAADADAGALATAPMTTRRVPAAAAAGATADDAAFADAREEPAGGGGGDEAAAAVSDGRDGPVDASPEDDDREPPPPVTTDDHTDQRPTFSLKLMLLEDDAMRSVFEGTDSNSYTDAESELYESESRGLAELVPLVGRLDAAVPAAALSAGSS